MGDLRAEDIRVGAVYRAKRPRRTVGGDVLNDRHVLWVNGDRTRVQYDSPIVPDGRHYPTVNMDAFLKWARREVDPRQEVP
jgi:hypothetical protein